MAARTTSNKTCCECHNLAQVEVYSRNAATIIARVALYRAKNKPAVAARHKAYAEANTEKLRAYRAQRYVEKREQITKRIREYRQARPGFAVAVGKAYLARKERAMPPWADVAAIGRVYELAARLTQETGVTQSVDHIYPLKGRNVCGLHVVENLRIIPKVENCRKGNKHPDEIVTA